MDPLGKKRRTGAALLELGRRDSHVTQNGITTMLKVLNRDGLPKASSRPTIYRERKKFAATRTPYGAIVQDRELHLTTGERLKVGIQHPMAFTRHCFDECVGFRNMIDAAVRTHGLDRPWRLLLYNDGVTPQDSASSHDKRKLINIYWSLAEFGLAALSSEEAWSVLTVLRTSKVEEYNGGLSRFTGEVLEREFADWEARGVELPNVGTLRAKLWCFVSDEPALKDFFLHKGHAGMLPCCLCWNVILHRFYDAAVHPAPYVSTTCFDWTAFRRHTDESLRTLFLDLSAKFGNVDDDQFEELCLAAGLNYSDHSLLRNEAVRPPSQMMYDYAHTYVVGGLIDTEFGMAMKELKRAKAPTTYEALYAFITQFRFPARQSINAKKLFDAAAIRSHLAANAFKSTASELLTLAPVVNFYMTTVAARQGILLPIVRSLVAGFDALSLLQTVRHGCVTPDVLRDGIRNHLELFKTAYGDAHVRPKHHYACHLARMLELFGTLVSCLAMERLHKVAKRYVAPRRNTTGYELCTLEDVTLQQFHDRQADFLAVNCLVEGHELHAQNSLNKALLQMYPLEPKPLVARILATSYGQVALEDVVFYTVGGIRCCGQVKLHVELPAYKATGVHVVSFIEQWEQIPSPDLEPLARRYKVNANAKPYDSTTILGALTYSVSAGIATVLLPPLFR